MNTAGHGAHHGRKKRIICIDDELYMRHAVFRVLHARPHEVVLAKDGEEALEMVRTLVPDLIVLDIMMPGMDGYAVVRTLHEEGHSRIPIVMLTAKDADKDIVEGYRTGATYYLTKPFNPDVLLNVVDYLVGDLAPEERAALELKL